MRVCVCTSRMGESQNLKEKNNQISFPQLCMSEFHSSISTCMVSFIGVWYVANSEIRSSKTLGVLVSAASEWWKKMKFSCCVCTVKNKEFVPMG